MRLCLQETASGMRRLPSNSQIVENPASADFMEVNALNSKCLLETDRLTLRKCAFQDLEIFAEMLGDAAMTQHFGQGRPLTSAEVKAWLEFCVRHYDRHGWGPVMLVWRADEEVVGLGVLTYMLHDPESPEGDLIFLVRKAYWGMGYSTEFARAAVTYMLCQTSIERVVATAMPENLASNRVLAKMGMHFTDLQFRDKPKPLYGQGR